MLLLLATVLVLSISTYLYLRWSKLRSYWADRKVPHLDPHFLYGSLTFLMKINTGLWFREMYNKFNDSPYFGIWLFWRPALVINCPEIGKNILIKDSDNFRNRFLSSGQSDPIGSLNLFTVNDPLWSSLRKRLTASFTSAKLRGMHNLVTEKSQQLVQRIGSELKTGEEIDIRSLYADYTSDIIGTAAFGVNCDATLTGESPIRTVTKEFMKFNLIRGFAWTSIFFLPEVCNLFRFSLFPKHSTEYFKKVFKTIALQREREKTDHKDILDSLLKIKKDAEKNNEEITDDILIAQAAIFLQGGFDTSAAALTFLSYELAFHLEAQDKLYQEILETKNKIGDRDFEFDDLTNLPYMTAVINEVLRLYPAMGFLDRIADKDYKVDENLTIPAGTPVYVNAVGMQCDPDFYPDPMQFNPDRFLPENEKDITPFTFMPFGEGPRICIGQRFAFVTMRYAIAAMFLKYKVQPLPNALKPRDVEIEKKGMFLMPGQQLSVKYVPRK